MRWTLNQDYTLQVESFPLTIQSLKKGHYDLRIDTGGVATMSSKPLQMLHGRGVLHIATSQTPAEVYTLSGVCVCSVDAQSRMSIALYPGVYVVKCGDKRYRIIL